MTVWVGTSGWVYGDWRGAFYPEQVPQRGWLAHYASEFATVELNNSFYRLPTRRAFEAWRRTVRPPFTFAVKASRFITHVRRLRDGTDPNRLLEQRARGLGTRLGPVLYQLPPRFPVDIERLRWFVRTIPPLFRPAFEFRDPSWLIDEVYELLDGAGAALVLADTPGARIPEVITGGWSYVRFHRGQRDAYAYARTKLRRWADRIAQMEASDVFVYFNNDQGAAAPFDALALIELLEQRGVEVMQPRATAPARARLQPRAAAATTPPPGTSARDTG